MTRDELLAALECLDDCVPFDYPETTEAYYKLKEFIMDKTKDEAKVPILLKGKEP